MTTKIVAPPIKKKRQRLPAEKRRAQIIKAAQKVFVRLGLNGARTRDLANEAGVNEATLFLYFKNKQDIFDAAIVEPLSSLVKIQKEKGNAFANTPDLESKNEIGFEAHKEIYATMEKLAPLLVTALFSNTKLGTEIYRRDIYPMINKLSEAAKKSFTIDDDSSEFVVLAALGLNFVNLMHHQFMGTKPDSDLIAQRISSLFLDGAYAEKPAS